MAASGEGRPTLERRLAEAADLVTVALDELLPRGEGAEARLTEAMRYAALGPGRRLRPFFTLEAARLFDVEERSVLRAACALECIHAYSLVHRQLPGVGDDDHRRGRSAVHRQYDQATAILAGDALQTAAFEIMAHPDTHEDGEIRAALVYRLARASGAKGLAGGQMITVLGDGDDVGRSVRMQRMKTGALISFAFEIPVVMARPGDVERNALRSFGQDLGLAYQLSNAGAEGRNGAGSSKRAAAREAKGRVHEVVADGRIAASERIALLSAQCKAHLDIFGEEAKYLRECVDFVLDRHA